MLGNILTNHEQPKEVFPVVKIGKPVADPFGPSGGKLMIIPKEKDLMGDQLSLANSRCHAINRFS